ncbi:MAG TPA: type II secretion system F family protein [Pirellulales bacterium]|jgi:general secretion pathway protein F/type IV pilus assembly protein PilC|nr:type II secretion system F family protein [Pirellulales bacterium]
MPEFAYVARDMAGQRVTGKLSAASEREALSTLGQKALFPLSVEAERSAAQSWRGRRISPQLMAITYGQLGDLLGSGVPLLRALEVLQRQSSSAALAEVLSQIKSQVEEGESLSDAMLRYPRVFSEMAVNMVRAGGEGGFLEEALHRVSEFTEKQEDLKGRTMGALAYPVFLAVIGTSVVTVLVVFFVPKFAELFSQLRERGELPFVTDWLLATSDLLRHWGIVILAALIGLFMFARTRLATAEGRLWFDRWKVRVPGAGKILLNLAVARFCRVLGTLLHNGVPILKSLEISSDATGNRMLALAVQEAAKNISSGQTLAAPLAACGHFPATIVEMIGVAEESNTLETVLINIADGLERRTWRQLDLFVRLLEPLMLLALAGAVLVVVIALLLPVIKMSTTI